MLKSVRISGLKSLKNLKLDLQPGLNVLVGPNGSGKSNILTAFDLISKLENLERVNFDGFVGSTPIAQLFDAQEKNKKIEITAIGEIETLVENSKGQNGRKKNGKRKNVELHYEYKCQLKYQPEIKNKLYFSKQLLDLQVPNKSQGSIKRIQIEYAKNQVKINHFDPYFAGDLIETAGKTFSENANKVIGEVEKIGLLDKNTKKEIEKRYAAKEYMEKIAKDRIESVYNQRNEEVKHKSLIHDYTNIYPPLQSVAEELESGHLYDVDPKLIRKSISVLDEPVVASDGTRLFSELLSIYENANGSKKPVFNKNGSRNSNMDIYNSIIGLLQDVLPEATGLDVAYDEVKQEVVGKVKFELDNGKKSEMAAELLSDGSLKWLALITILLTKKNLFVMEEPENFLHPAMQHYIIDLMRETAESKKNEIRLFSTHCETILNLIDPENVILTYFRNGQTQVKRIKNPELLKQAIQETGFGIGSHLITGAFDYGNEI